MRVVVDAFTEEIIDRDDDAEFLGHFPLQTFFRGLTVPNFTARKFPFVGQSVTGFSSGDQNFVISDHNGSGYILHGR